MRRLVPARATPLEAAVLKIEQALARLIAASPDLAARERLPRCAPGTGPAKHGLLEVGGPG